MMVAAAAAVPMVAVAAFVYWRLGRGPARIWHEGPEWEEFFRSYDRIFELDWPADTTSVQVPTSFGRTHVNCVGPPSGQPLLLLPGTGASSAMWGGLATVLAKTHRVFAVDLVGDLGRSMLERMPTSAAELVQWSREVLQGLDVERAQFVGMSYGCWIAAHVASEAPELVDRLVLLAPAGVFAPMRGGFVARVLPAVLWPSEPMVSRAVAYQVASLSSIRPDVMRFIIAAFRVPRLSFGVLPAPDVVADEVLRRIEVQTLLLVGDMERVTDGKAAVERASLLLPRLKTEMVTGAGHMLTDEQPGVVHARVAAFLMEQALPS